MEMQRRLVLLNQRVKMLENENNVLRQRLSDVISGQEDVQSYMKRNCIANMLHVDSDSIMKKSTSSDSVPSLNGSVNLLNLSNSSGSMLSLNHAPPVPARSSVRSNGEHSPDPSVGTRLEGLLLDELDDDFNPRAHEQSATGEARASSSPSNSSPTKPPILAPPPKSGRDAARRSNSNSTFKTGADDVFGSSNAISTATPRPKPQDPFGMGNFSIPINGSADDDFHNLGLLDKKMMEMKDGFSRGLSISAEDFSLESLDPLRN